MDLLLYTSILSYLLALVSIHLKKVERYFPSILLLAWAIHTALLVLRGLATGHAPMIGRYESLLFFGWSITSLNLFLLYRYRFRTADSLNILIVLASLLFALYSEKGIYPVPIVLKTRWFEVHVVTSFFSYALFTIAATSGAFYLLMEKKGPPSRLRALQEIIYRSALWGFFLFSLSMTFGAIWAYLAWGRYWLWEPKTLSSMVLWLYFAGLIHTRFLKGWRGRRLGWVAVAGFGFTLFTYLGVSILLPNSHRM